MSFESNGDHWLQAILPDGLVPAATRLCLTIRCRPITGGSFPAYGSINMICQAGIDNSTASASPYLMLLHGNTLLPRIQVTAAWSGSALTDNGWNVVTGAFGPWDATSRRTQIAVNGGAFSVSNTTYTPVTSASHIKYLWIGQRFARGGAYFRGRTAELGLFVNLTEGQEQTVSDEMQTHHVDKLPTYQPLLSWRLHYSGLLVPATGGVTLTQTGGVASTDDPEGLLGDEGGEAPAAGYAMYGPALAA
jgi:hypothetical protein